MTVNEASSASCILSFEEFCYVYVYVARVMCACECSAHGDRGMGSSGAGVIGCCEPSEDGAGDQPRSSVRAASTLIT